MKSVFQKSHVESLCLSKVHWEEEGKDIHLPDSQNFLSLILRFSPQALNCLVWVAFPSLSKQLLDEVDVIS